MAVGRESPRRAACREAESRESQGKARALAAITTILPIFIKAAYKIQHPPFHRSNGQQWPATWSINTTLSDGKS